MLDVRPWLCQGDVFEQVPFYATVVAPDGNLVPEFRSGPSLLLTHSCDLDKRSRSGQLRLERMQFLPLSPLAEQDASRQALLRRQGINPPEAFYVGEVDGVGEAFALLSQMVTVPASFFDLALASFDGHPDAEPGARYVTARANGGRIGRLGDQQLALLYQKIVAYWPRSQLA